MSDFYRKFKWSLNEDENAAGFFVTSGKVYLAQGKRLVIYDHSGNVLQEIKNDAAGDNIEISFADVVVDEENEKIYVVDGANHRYLVFDLAGNFIQAFGSEGSGNCEFEYPWGIAIDDDNIYIVDTGNSRGEVFRK